MFICLKFYDVSTSESVRAAHMYQISNGLHVNDVISSFEPATSDTRPFDSSGPGLYQTELLDAHNEVVVKSNLNLILKSKSVNDMRINFGDIVELFIHFPIKKENFGHLLNQY